MITKYRIMDEQIPGRYFADGELFNTKEQVRKQLCDFHGIDWNGETQDGKPLDINTLTLDEILEYGGWKLEEVKFSVAERLEYLRQTILREDISYEEIAELQGYKKYIDKNDVLLLQWAGVKENSK